MLIDIEYNLDEIPGVDPRADCYSDEAAFISDLKLIDASLRDRGDARLADAKLKDLVSVLKEGLKIYCTKDGVVATSKTLPLRRN
jgi:phosphoenolpyruvate carboxylase